MSVIWSFIATVLTFARMMAVNCPQYGNMPACLAMFTQIPTYYHDIRGFRPPQTVKQGSTSS